jgi:hypothetical protein
MFLLFLQQFFPMMTVNVILMKNIGLLGHKLLLHHQSKPGHLNHLLPLPNLCVPYAYYMNYLHYIYFYEFFPQVRRHIVHTMVGGGGQHGGYDAIDYRKIHQGNADKLGNYPDLSVLPDKFARFLFEYHSRRFQSLHLPQLPADRSDFDVHGALLDDKVQTNCHTLRIAKSCPLLC